MFFSHTKLINNAFSYAVEDKKSVGGCQQKEVQTYVDRYNEWFNKSFLKIVFKIISFSGGERTFTVVTDLI